MLTRRLRFRWFHQNRVVRNGCVWLGAFAAVAVAPALSQGPPGAAEIAAGAAAAATVSAPAPKRAQGNSVIVSPGSKAADPSKATEEDASGALPPDVAALAAKLESGPPLKGVALQCANLLKLATNLKTAVSKTTKDELSIPVVRDAGQIQDIAHKMRDQQPH